VQEFGIKEGVDICTQERKSAGPGGLLQSRGLCRGLCRGLSDAVSRRGRTGNLNDDASAASGGSLDSEAAAAAVTV
jgi:hypothetical protein